MNSRGVKIFSYTPFNIVFHIGKIRLAALADTKLQINLRRFSGRAITNGEIKFISLPLAEKLELLPSRGLIENRRVGIASDCNKCRPRTFGFKCHMHNIAGMRSLTRRSINATAMSAAHIAYVLGLAGVKRNIGDIGERLVSAPSVNQPR